MPPIIDVTGVSISPKTSNAEAGTDGSRQLSATIEPDDATNPDVTYTSDLNVTDGGLLSWEADTPAGTYTTIVTAGAFTDAHALTLREPEPEEPTDSEEGE